MVLQGGYEFSKHAARERELDIIYTWEIEDSFGNFEIIEDYPDGPRGASCLILDFCGNKPLLEGSSLTFMNYKKTDWEKLYESLQDISCD